MPPSAVRYKYYKTVSFYYLFMYFLSPRKWLVFQRQLATSYPFFATQVTSHTYNIVFTVIQQIKVNQLMYQVSLH